MSDTRLISILKSPWPQATIKVKDQAQQDLTQKTPLDQIKDRLQQAELQKYPNPPYEAHIHHVSLDNPKIETKVLYVNYWAKQKLNQQMLADIRNAALDVRKLNLVAGVINAMTISDNYFSLTQQQRKTIEDRLFELLDKSVHTQSSPSHEMDRFITEITAIIAAQTNVEHSEIIRKIRSAERYFVAENNANRTLVFEHTRQNLNNKTTYYQIDVPLGHAHSIHDNLKQELLMIHDQDEKNHPVWFRVLPKWEQDCIAHLVPNTLDGDWNQFIQSSAMQHIPGLKNARVNFLVENKDEKLTVLSKSIKTSTLIPYEMPKDLQKHAAKIAAAQLLSVLEQEAQENFNNKWGNVFANVPNKPKPLVFVHSLLSDTVFGALDNGLTKKQIKAIKKLKDHFPSVNIITGNEPVNVLRRLTTQHHKRWKYAKKVMAAADNFFDSIPKEVKLNDEQKKSRRLIEFLYLELNNMKDSSLSEKFKVTFGERNFEAFKTAYVDIIVEEMGGAVSTNCKSGKDRTGLDELYRHAIRLYYNTYGDIPRFSDTGLARKQFIQIYVELFNTMKTQEAAALSTPGSFGLKDDALMLCSDIAHALEETYKYSNENAAMNKPDQFMHDEEKQMRALTSTTKMSGFNSSIEINESDHNKKTSVSTNEKTPLSTEKKEKGYSIISMYNLSRGRIFQNDAQYSLFGSHKSGKKIEKPVQVEIQTHQIKKP